MEAVAQGGDAQQSMRLRRRARIARAILLVAVASIVLGVAGRFYQTRIAKFWQSRFIRGEPVVVRFICGTDPALDCKLSVKITYQKQDSKWCENLQRSDQSEIDEAHWCNASPELGTISLFGAPYSFDRFGAVRNEDRVVGQLFER
jgi:hypothetical protein